MSSMSGRTEMDDAETLSTAIITAMAEHEGIDPVELDHPLYEVVDPDALDALFPVQRDGTGAPIGRLSFSYNGYEVHVTSDGDVRVSDSSER